MSSINNSRLIKYNTEKSYTHPDGTVGHAHPPLEEITKNISKLTLVEAHKIFTQIKADIRACEDGLRRLDDKNILVRDIFHHEKESDEGLLIIVSELLKNLTSKLSSGAPAQDPAK